MTLLSPCPVCGAEIPEGAPEAMCPRCLLGLADARMGEEATVSGVAPQSEEGATAREFATGMRVGGYELVREIGRGGMGVVYEARHTGLNRKVALKVLPWAAFASEEQRERFRREAEAAARLIHPHIVSVFEWGDHEGCPYMAMQIVPEARSLADVISQGPMSPREAAGILAKVARAVHYSHQHGVLHRDIKPGNVLLDAKGEPLLVDFGLARLEDSAFKLTHSNLVFGTPSYMPPEQAAGSDVTTASDVYSLGAVLYETLTGKTPFHGKSVPDIMRQVAEQEAPSPRTLRPELDRDIATIVLKCLEKSPSRRYGSAEALAEDLERWQAHWPIRARPSTITMRAVKWARRRPGVAGLVAALVFTAFIGLTGIVLGWREAVAARKEQTDQFWDSLLAEARSRRWSHQPGQRFEAIEALQRAAAIRPSNELQNEAVAALALSDLRPADVWQGNPDKLPLVALTPDFALVASTRIDGTIVVCEREDAKPLATLPGHGTPVGWILRFSPDGRWLAAGYCKDGEEQVNVVVWDWKASRPMLNLEHVTRASLDFWPDGSRVVACVGNELRFHRLPDGEVERPRRLLPGSAHAVRVSAGGRFVAASMAASSQPAGHVALLELTDPAAEILWMENTSAVQLLSWHPRMDWLAAPCEDGSIRIWDATEQLLLHKISGHTDHVVEAVWNPEGDLMATNSADGTLKLWDASTGELFVSMEQPTGPLSFSKDGTRLGPGLDSATVRLFEVAPLTACRRLRSPPDGMVRSAAWSSDGGLLATASRQVRLWNTAGFELARLDFALPRSVLFCKDSLIVTGGEGVVRWPVKMEEQGAKRRAVIGEPKAMIREHEWEFGAVSADGRVLAVASAHEVALFDLASEPGTPPRYLRGHTGASNVAVSHDGRLLATGTAKGNEVWVWDVASGATITRLPVRGGANVVFTVKGESLITGNAEEFRCWDTTTWQPGAVHPRRDDAPGLIAVSPRGTAAALDYSRHRVRLVASHNLMTVVDPECGPHAPLCFSPDGAVFVSTNNQGHGFLWDVAWIRHEVARLKLDWNFPELPSSSARLVNEAVVLRSHSGE